MLRTAGCMLVILSGMGIGRIVSDTIQKKYILLSRLHDMAAEITVMLSSLVTTGDILNSLYSSEKYHDLTFLSCDITRPDGRTNIANMIGTLPADKDIKDQLIRFFNDLGTADCDHECAKAQLLTANLAQSRDELAQHYRSDKKLARVLGLMSGAFAAVILV
ncbi:MAG: hypothetical protein IJ740_06395 [Ruminococcus sp.]|nr:hypothetical protein [Ruminococcus sp.]